MRAQTLGSTTASVTGNYAENLAGVNSSLGDVRGTGNYLADGLGSLNGTIDSQSDNNGLGEDAATSGTYSVDPTLGVAPDSVGGVPVSFYTVATPGTTYTSSPPTLEPLPGHVGGSAAVTAASPPEPRPRCMAGVFFLYLNPHAKKQSSPRVCLLSLSPGQSYYRISLVPNPQAG